MAIKFDFDSYPGRKIFNIKRIYDGIPIVSVITPSMSDDQAIQEMYYCLKNQTFPWFEWLIIDDGTASESSKQQIRLFSETDKRLIIINKNRGTTASAKNIAISNAKAPYVFFLMPNDLIEPTCLEYCYLMLEKNPDAAWAYGANCSIGEKNIIIDVPYSAEGQLNENTLLLDAMFRKAWIQKIGGFEEVQNSYFENWLFYIKLISIGAFPVQSRGEVLIWHRESNNTIFKVDAQKSHQDEECKNQIHKITQDIVDLRPGVIYPIIDPCRMSFCVPKRSKFERKCYKNDGKNHILFLLHWFSRGGADRFNLQLLQGIDRSRYTVTVITTLKGENEWLQIAREYTDEIFNAPNFMDMSNLPELMSYFIESRNINLIFNDISYLGYYTFPWIRKEYPEVAIVDYIHMIEKYWRRGGYARLGSVMDAVIDHTYICNTVTTGELVTIFGREASKLSTVPVGVDDEYYDKSKIEEGSIRKKYNISKDAYIILFPCRLCAQKRPFLMLQIAGVIEKMIPQAVFLVVGDGPDLSEMVEEVKNLGLNENVVFAGASDDMLPFYRDATVTLICSISEGLTLTAYESLSMGVPVVSSDVGGQRDLVDDTTGALIPLMQDEKDDFNSRVFSGEEVQAYVNAICKLLNNFDFREQASLNGRKRIVEHFSSKQMTAYFNHEFQHIIDDQSLALKREESGKALRCLGDLAEELFYLSLLSEYGVHPDSMDKKITDDEIIINKIAMDEERIKRSENRTFRKCIKDFILVHKSKMIEKNLVPKAIHSAIVTIYNLVMIWTLILVLGYAYIWDAHTKAFRIENIGFIILFIPFGVAICFVWAKHGNYIREIIDKYNKYFLPASLFLFFIFQVYCCYGGYFQTGWDPQVIRDTAIYRLNNRYDLIWQNYYSIHPNNILIMCVYSALIKIADLCGFEQLEFSLVLFQCLIDAISMYLIYVISYTIYKNKSLALICYVIAILFIGFSPWFIVAYSDSTGIIIPLIIVRLYQRYRNNRRSYIMLMIGAVTVIGFLIKPQTAIVTIAIAIAELLFLRKKGFIQYTQKMVWGIRGGIIVLVIYSFILIPSTNIKIDKNCALGWQHYFMTGLNNENYGGYSEKDYLFSIQFSNTQERGAANLAEARSRINSYGIKGLFRHINRKQLVNYGDGTFAWGVEGGFFLDEPSWAHNNMSGIIRSLIRLDGKNYWLFHSAKQMMWIIILFFCSFAFLFNSKTETIEFECIFTVMALSIVGLTVFELLFEARARYLFVYSPIFVILSICGTRNCFRNILYIARKKHHNGKI